MTAIVGDSCPNAFKDILEDQFREKSECFTRKQILLLMDKIKQRLQRTREKSLGSLFLIKNELPCIFLENGMCSIYEVRPFICRAWNSMDSSLCKKIFNSGKFDDENVRLSVNPAFNPDDRCSYRDFNMLREWYAQFGFKGDSCLSRIPRQGQ